METLMTEDQYKGQSNILHNSKHRTYELDMWIKEQKPLIISDSFTEAKMLVKLAIEKINQHNGIIERKLNKLKRKGHIDSNGDKSYC